MRNIEFCEDNFTIHFERPGVEIDLGGYAKGYAIERAMNILKEHGVENALLHGGTSSVFAIGAPPQRESWKIALSAPLIDGDEPIIVELHNAGLSVSAAHGKSFSAGDAMYGHVLDPRTGEAIKGAPAAAVTGPSPAVCEALSTALLVLGPGWLPEMKSSFPAYDGIIAASHDTR
jgi:thiamine biosynthesis lipoprotein